MNVSDALLPEFDQEMAGTRKVLERLPEDKYSWKPHAKSFSAGALASHLATLPSWVGVTLKQDGIDLSGPYTPKNVGTRAELLEMFDRNVAEARAELAGAANDVFFQPWSLRKGEMVFFTLPKAAVIRSWVMSHSIHHRAQLTMYLRLNDVAVPGLYGPSADEASM
jgi:uncharacterized damage-inducible protein DinB